MTSPCFVCRVIENAGTYGVSRVLATGVSLEESRETIELIKALDPARQQLWCTVGVHPTNSQEFLKYKSPDLLLEELKKIINENRDIVKAYGEFGLDRARTSYCPFDIQEKFFEPQLVLAEHMNLPLFLHNREASDLFYRKIHQSNHAYANAKILVHPFFTLTHLSLHSNLAAILERHPDALKKGGVVHSFDGTPEDIEKILELGLDIGVNGCSIREEATWAAIRAMPADRIHAETDAPWCSIKATHASYPLIKWTKSEATVVKSDKNKVEPSSSGAPSSATLSPTANATSPANASTPVNVSPHGTITVVKSRNEPCFVNQVVECIFRIKYQNNGNYDDFREFSEKSVFSCICSKRKLTLRDHVVGARDTFFHADCTRDLATSSICQCEVCVVDLYGSKDPSLYIDFTRTPFTAGRRSQNGTF